MLPKRLSARLKLLTLLWLLVAVASIVLTLVLSWRLEGGAAAINDTGSLRMQTYRLGLLLESRAPEAEVAGFVGDFDHTIGNLVKGVPERPLFLPDDEAVQQNMALLRASWQNEVKPWFLAVSAGKAAFDRARIPPFIQTIDTLTKSIEAVNNRYINRLRLFQLVLLALVTVSSLVMVVLLYAWIILPLGRLQNGVNAIHEGDFGVQVPTDHLTEFAEVDKGFNQMSTRLRDLYQNLEQEVADKTRDLAEKNRSLETLYFFSHLLSQTLTVSEAAEGFLAKIMEMVPQAKAGSIRLIDFQRKRMDLIAHAGLPENLQTAEACRRLEECSCGTAAGLQGPQTVDFYKTRPTDLAVNEPLCSRSGFHFLRVFKISSSGHDLGMMTLYFTEAVRTDSDTALIEALCRQLGVAVSNLRLGIENRQLAVLQERNLIAQGLHDSIAQTLTFLNLQIQMLDKALDKSDGKRDRKVDEKLQFIKEGVQECYEDVRELLLNFRTKITRNEFNEAVEQLVSRFRQQTGTHIEAEWHDDGPQLTAEQQLQFIFILQESLSNIRKHARAQNVCLTFRNQDDFEMTIEDDGCGFDTAHLNDFAENGHVGLNIMFERAKRIRARLDITSEKGSRTAVTLRLPQQERTPE
ncbi:type IV pili methyl-accepting chemotaxis transducer N-terminal domain-containing protein [Neisseria chenwenguii]|uniref:Sensor protein n=1 Tax=Neisseria chenwenguii TaxID=1853278 RepID=A0A220S2S8_9NEIS|nr:type IV pili methyl-accepting chemotaxis transducer N-terminal domain-containing protein [Neisseria chenwenguii]ASK27780.1 histidine kinase [Neisseria chenwenguii]ROV56522.1 HAMP domain-containing protein [Neisseria chenwenguii]